MIIRRFSTALDECLFALQQGDSVETCLARYPKHANRLRPLLTLAYKVGKTPQAVPRPQAQAAAWNRARNRAADLRSPRRGFRVGFSYAAWLRPVAIAAAFVFAVMAGGGATALAAQSSLPDSTLYRVKLATEDVQLWLVFDETHEAEILIDQSRERTEEIESMLGQSKLISSNVLSALRDRNERSAVILAKHPEKADLLANLLLVTEDQENLLISHWIDIEDSARGRYNEAVVTVHNIRLQQGSAGLVSIRADELSEGIQVYEGLAEQIGENLWSVGGFEVRIDEGTIGSRELQAGTTARLIAGKSSRGNRRALSVTTVQTDLPSSGSVVSGEIEAINDEGITLAGQFIPFAPGVPRPKFERGTPVSITTTADGVVATSVSHEGLSLTWEGAIQSNTNNPNRLEVSGLEFTTTATTSVDAKAGKYQNNARVFVEASNEDGDLRALKITVLASASAPDSIHLVGVFQGTNDGLWEISGLEIVPPENVSEPAIDSLVAIDALREGDEIVGLQVTVLETPDESGVVRFQGAIKTIDSSLWTTEFGNIRVTSTAEVSGGDPLVGSRVIAWARPGSDGTLLVFYARVLDQTSVITIATPVPSE